MNNKIIIITTFILIILLMTAGYSAFNAELKINGDAQITGNWNVRITNIEVDKQTEGSDAGKPTYTNTSATFSAHLNKPGDEITYKITITNLGTIDATLQNITFSEPKNSAKEIIFTYTTPAKELKAHESTSFLITIKYDEKTKKVPINNFKNITGNIEYIQK